MSHSVLGSCHDVCRPLTGTKIEANGISRPFRRLEALLTSVDE
jgi:hypothetical protein